MLMHRRWQSVGMRAQSDGPTSVVARIEKFITLMK
jgi:hypothetical protein